MIPVLSPVRRWHCPACGLRDETREALPHTRFHTCPALRGLTAPMLPEGIAGKSEVREREDYIGSEQVQLAEGRPVMSIVTTRDEGQDVVVFAPSATARAG